MTGGADRVVMDAAGLREGLAGRLVERLGLHRADAEATVDHWVRSEQAGKASHGLVRALYVTGSGLFGPYGGACAPGPERGEAGQLHVDGAGHLGYAVMRRLVEAGCAAAERGGSCVVTGAAVYPSGMLGDWARLACERGCGLVLVSGSPPRVAAPEGRVPLLGTNPICVGLPTRPGYFVCDSSTSAITHGDLLLAREAGARLPEGVAVDRDGVRTREAAAVDPGGGALLSVGGSHKTFALGMAVELLACLGGGVPGSARLGEHGVFALFLGPGLVAAAAPVFSARLAAFAAAGARIPGWSSARRAAEQAARGVVEVSAVTHARLQELLAS